MLDCQYVSIGIPIYNAEKYLADAIKSVLVQTYPYWELILIDDGSTDGSLAIAEKFSQQDKRIRVISDGQNKKLPARLNQIIREAKYDFIARMDADDLISPIRLEKQLTFLQKNSQFEFVSTGVLSLKSDLSLVGYRTTNPDKTITMEDAVMGTTGIIHASIVAKKAWFLRNLYNEDNKLAEDYELWLKAFLNHDLNVGFIEEPLYYYREDQNIRLEKLLRAYSSQIEIISSLSETELNQLVQKKFVRRFLMKKIIVRILFALRLHSVLHKRRIDESKNSELLPILQRDIAVIKSIRL